MSLDIIISTLSADATSSIYIVLLAAYIYAGSYALSLATWKYNICTGHDALGSTKTYVLSSPFDGRDRVELILSHQEPGNLLVGNKSLTALCRVLVLKAYPALNVYVNARG